MHEPLNPDQLENLLETMEPHEIRAQYAQSLAQAPECEAILHQFEQLDQNLINLKHMQPAPKFKPPGPKLNWMKWALPAAACLLIGSVWLLQRTAPVLPLQVVAIPAVPQQNLEEAPAAIKEYNKARRQNQDTPPERPAPAEAKHDDALQPKKREAAQPATPPTVHVGRIETDKIQTDTSPLAEAEQTQQTYESLAVDEHQPVYETLVVLPNQGSPQEAGQAPPARLKQKKTNNPQDTLDQDLWAEELLDLMDHKGHINHLFTPDAQILIPYLKSTAMTREELSNKIADIQFNSDEWLTITIEPGKIGLLRQENESLPGKIYQFELNEAKKCVRLEPHTP